MIQPLHCWFCSGERFHRHRALVYGVYSTLGEYSHTAATAIMGRAASRPNHPREPTSACCTVGRGRRTTPQTIRLLKRYSHGRSCAALLVTTLALNPAGTFQKMITAAHTASATQGSSSTLSRRPEGL